MVRKKNYEDLVCFNFYVGWRLSQTVYADLFETNGLNPQRLYVLGLVVHNEPTVAELARGLRTNSQAISNLLKRMEADGLLERHQDKRDRRVVHVRATEEGRRRIAGVAETVSGFDDRIDEMITPEELAGLQKAVACLEKIAERQQAKAEAKARVAAEEASAKAALTKFG